MKKLSKIRCSGCLRQTGGPECADSAILYYVSGIADCALCRDLSLIYYGGHPIKNRLIYSCIVTFRFSEVQKFKKLTSRILKIGNQGTELQEFRVSEIK